MDEKNNGARRRKAFADFKENQYDDSFSLNPAQQRYKTAKRVLKIVLIVVLTAAFIILGFCFTDSLMTISQKPYKDRHTYTAAYVNTTSEDGSSGEQTDEEESSVSEQNSSSSMPSPYQSPYQTTSQSSDNQNQTAGNY